MSDTPPSAQQPRTGRGLKIALGLSLALNLLIIGAIGGAVLGGRPEGGMRDRIGHARSLGLGPMALALEREDRAALVARAEAGREGERPDRRQLLQATRNVAELVAADPFDRDATEAALAELRAMVGDLTAYGHGALLDQLATMSAEARAGFSDRLLRGLARHRP